MKKAIVAVPYLSGKGGTETVIKNFYDALVRYSGKQKWDWRLVSFGGTKYSSWMNKWPKKVYNFSNNRIVQFGCYASIMPFLIRAILKREQPDVFVATNPIIWTLAYRLRNKFSPKTKIIAWYHYSFKEKNVKTKYLKTADRFWAISNGIREELISMGVSSDRIDLIYNPIPIKNIDFVTRSGTQNHFIYIGRIDYSGQKNVSELIKAFNQLNGIWHCDLYGNVNKDTKERLLKLANKNTLKNISFKGFYNNVWNHIETADVLILTSKYEGLGMVLCEGATRGIELVSSDCPMGPSEIVNKNNGYLYTPGKVKELKNILNNFITKKVILSSQSEIKKSVEKFSFDRYALKVTNSLEKLVIEDYGR